MEAGGEERDRPGRLEDELAGVVFFRGLPDVDRSGRASERSVRGLGGDVVGGRPRRQPGPLAPPLPVLGCGHGEEQVAMGTDVDHLGLLSSENSPGA